MSQSRVEDTTQSTGPGHVTDNAPESLLQEVLRQYNQIKNLPVTNTIKNSEQFPGELTQESLVAKVYQEIIALRQDIDRENGIESRLIAVNHESKTKKV